MFFLLFLYLNIYNFLTTVETTADQSFRTATKLNLFEIVLSNKPETLTEHKIY